MENIKSTFFIRLLFSYVEEKIKMKIAKYNKNLQNRMNLNLINYKFFSKKYIIYEEKNKG